MDRIESESSRMAHLVEDLLLLARLDEDCGFEMAPVDLSRIVSEAVSDFRVVAPDRPVDIRVADKVMVQGDALRLRQVIDNLLSNARIHTPAGTPVHVELSKTAQLATLAVGDEGPGLTAKQRERVFERFWRGDPGRSRSRGGSGFGLAIVASIVQAHQGKVRARGEEGQGAEFAVTMPVFAGQSRHETV